MTDYEYVSACQNTSSCRIFFPSIYIYIYIYIYRQREREAAFDCFVVRYVKNTKFEQDVTVNFISNHTFKNLQNYRTITDR